MWLTHQTSVKVLAVTLAIIHLSMAQHIVKKELCKRGPKKIISACKQEHHFMLAFDDGPSNITRSLVEKLKEEDVKAAMFINGNNGRCIYDYAEDLQDAYRAGHAVGSHTWSHTSPDELTGPMMEEELDKIEEAMNKILGLKPKLHMPPYGQIDKKNVNVSAGFDILHKRGYNTVYWTVTANSGDDEGPAYALEQFDKFLNQNPAPKSGISVSLDPNEEVVTSVISQAIKKLVEHGFKMVDPETCLGVPIYDREPDLQSDLPEKDDTWKCD